MTYPVTLGMGRYGYYVSYNRCINKSADRAGCSSRSGEKTTREHYNVYIQRSCMLHHGSRQIRCGIPAQSMRHPCPTIRLPTGPSSSPAPIPDLIPRRHFHGQASICNVLDSDGELASARRKYCDCATDGRSWRYQTGRRACVPRGGTVSEYIRARLMPLPLLTITNVPVLATMPEAPAPSESGLRSRLRPGAHGEPRPDAADGSEMPSAPPHVATARKMACCFLARALVTAPHLLKVAPGGLCIQPSLDLPNQTHCKPLSPQLSTSPSPLPSNTLRVSRSDLTQASAGRQGSATSCPRICAILPCRQSTR